VAAAEIDAYLAKVKEPGRTVLEQLRETILAIIPEAEQGMSYGVPAFRVSGTPVVGFAAFKGHLGYYPHSGSVLPGLPERELDAYDWSKGTLRFPLDTPLPSELVEKLISARLREIDTE
jgi:uncharacterized protein YdhG (YjbR/CyaY superfamily)